MRWSRTLILPVLLLLLLAACGGSSSTNGNGNGNGGDESEAAQSQEESEAAEATPEESEDDGGNGGNGSGFDGDLEQLADDLTPPNSTETSRTTAGGVIFLTWESSDSAEDLANWYEDAIGDAGLEVFSRTSAGGSFSYIFGIEEGSDFGGVVSIGPTGSGEEGSGVALQIGEATGS